MQLAQMRPEALEQLPAMLARLVADLDSKPVAYCENTCEWSYHREQNMLGPAACQQDDITSTNCLCESPSTYYLEMKAK
ncbi:hypothetical protein PR048_015303 [Dryococelus australis]|uniref:Uncharacterized protein n=1 Tax=Dryococelus australis TaxID=614101 RepID=A0ABQ9HGP7_9NEOP|nr:hypothetical protein PR048_015303 [Dryococelus australis]